MNRLLQSPFFLVTALVLVTTEACASGGRGGFEPAPEPPGVVPGEDRSETPDSGAKPKDPGAQDQDAANPHDAANPNDATIPDAAAKDASPQDAAPTDDASAPDGGTIDPGPMCSQTPCSLVAPQCGCATGNACVIDGTGARLCAAAGTGDEGQPCGAGALCRPGQLCLAYPASTTLTMCAAFCNTDADCGSRALCRTTLGDGTGGTIPGATFCTIDCDPAEQTGCAPGSECTVYLEPEPSARFFTDCRAKAAAPGTQGSACSTTDDCGAGYRCLDFNGTTAGGTECSHWCKVGSGTGCGAGSTCFPFATPLSLGGIEYGYCR
ncbi:MAG: hypothetical protein KC416_02210 [Myxococcales bacterium]|nr:hypothetical protein [Myxococcales bacterium]